MNGAHSADLLTRQDAAPPNEVEQIVGRSEVHLVAWTDSGFTLHGVDPRSQYAECFWLPILGPSALWLVRHFAWKLERSPDGVDLALADVARSVGLGHRAGRNAPFFRTVERAINFSIVRVDNPGVIASRRRLPLISPRQLSRLPDSLRQVHTAFVENARDRVQSLVTATLSLNSTGVSTR